MTKPADLERPLSAQVQEAAALDAAGVSVNEIAERTGLTRQTISAYRNGDARYLTLRQEYMEQSLAPLTKKLAAARESFLDALPAVLQRLKAHLTAEVDDVPLYEVQARAAKLLLESPVIKQLFKDQSDSEDGSGRAAAVAAVQVIIKDEHGERSYDFIDGEVTGEDG